MDVVNPDSLRRCLALNNSWHRRMQPKGFVNYTIEVVDMCNFLVEDIS
jgi:hypothetical protein